MAFALKKYPDAGPAPDMLSPVFMQDQPQASPVLPQTVLPKVVQASNPHLAHTLQIADGMSGPITAAIPSTEPDVVQDPNPLNQIEGHLTNQLQRAFVKEDQPKGFFGKLGDTMAKVINYHPVRDENDSLVNQLQNVEKQQSEQALQGAQTEAQKSEVPLHQAQVAAAELIPATEQEATAYGIPIGTPLNAAIRGALAKQTGINVTKTKTTEAQNETKITAAQIAAEAKVAAATGKPQPHIITMQAGVPHVMERNPDDGAYSIDRGIAPPNFAQIATGVTMAVPDQQGNYTIQRLTPGSTMPTGSMTPTQSGSLIAPTGQEKTAAGRAYTVLQELPDLEKEIDANAASLGPILGSWDQFMQGKVGMDKPQFAHLRSSLMMASSAVALAHAVGRLPENLREEFESGINAPNQSPENLKAVLDAIKPWMVDMSNMAQPGYNQGRAPSQRGAAGAGGTGGGGGSVAPDGTRVKMADGSTQVKKGGKWVPE